tara:strand:- start:102 stop:1325 length:1224 start_codon:yes stop_codon:yes gene_type:complete
MEEAIFSTNSIFDFSKLDLAKPQQITGGNYFMRIRVNNSPLYIQPPKCIMKQSFLKSGKKYYSDLMFSNDNVEFLEWMENLETKCISNIFDNGSEWFEEKMEMHDIENYFTSPLKIFKSGKYYNLRVNVALNLGKPLIKVYNENEEIVPMEEIKEKTNVMTILEIKGVKCSATCFQLEIEVKQMMIVQPNNIFEKCLFKPKTAEHTVENIKSINEVKEPYKEEDINLQKPIETSIENKEDHEVLVEDVDESASDSVTNEEEIQPTNEDSNEHSNEETNEIKLIENNLEVEKEETKLETENNSIPEEQKEQNNNNEINLAEKKENEELEEFEFTLDKVSDEDPFTIKNKNNVYFEMYREAKKKARVARRLALSSYLEAKRIKNVYMLEDTTDSDEESDYENIEENEDE